MKNIKLISILLCLVLTFVCITACNDGNFPVTVGGTEIAKAPKKVVAFSEQAASAICALGYKSYLVGAPKEFLSSPVDGVTDIGFAYNVDFEKVYSLNPDLVIVPAELVSSHKESMALRNISVVTLETPVNYSQVAPYYEALSKMFLGNNKYTQAYDTYIGESERQIADIKKENEGINKRVAVFIEPGFPVTGDTLPGQALEKVGINNIAKDHTDYMMSYIDIVKADPEVIFCGVGTSQRIMENESYKDITAIKNGAVYEIDVTAITFAAEGFVATLKEMSTYLSKQ